MHVYIYRYIYIYIHTCIYVYHYLSLYVHDWAFGTPPTKKPRSSSVFVSTASSVPVRYLMPACEVRSRGPANAFRQIHTWVVVKIMALFWVLSTILDIDL